MNRPQLSALLSGTPKQINALIPNAENGLFSRFIFYSLTMKNEWMDVFADSGGQTLDERFLIYGRRFGIIDRTADKQILRFTKAGLLNRLSQGNYEKVNR